MKRFHFSALDWCAALLGVSLSLTLAGCSPTENEGAIAIAAVQARMSTCTQVRLEHHVDVHLAKCELPATLLREHASELASLQRPPWRLGKLKLPTPLWLHVTLLEEGREPLDFYFVREQMLVVNGADGEPYACDLASNKLAQAILAEIDKQRGDQRSYD